MPNFNPNRVFDPSYDVRDHGALLGQIRSSPPWFARDFVEKIRDAHEKQARVIVALTPKELSEIEAAMNGHGIPDLGRSVLDLPPLTLEQARKIARTDQASALLERAN